MIGLHNSLDCQVIQGIGYKDMPLGIVVCATGLTGDWNQGYVLTSIM